MPRRESFNPLLKSYPDSNRINSVSEGAELLYVRLIAATDDKGRFYANPHWVLAKLFTARMIRGQVTEDGISIAARRKAARMRLGKKLKHVCDDSTATPPPCPGRN
jgi:hypothetical protein